jgi:hypothetical protein
MRTARVAENFSVPTPGVAHLTQGERGRESSFLSSFARFSAGWSDFKFLRIKVE